MSISFAAERELIRRARAGEEDAFEELVAAFTPDLYHVVRRMTADTDQAEAFVQEAFWRFWQALPRYRDDRRFFPYLATIAANLVRDAWRKDRRIAVENIEFLSDLPDEQPMPEAVMEDDERLRVLAKTVESLPVQYRTVLALRYDAGLSYEEIAAGMDLPLNTVRTTLHRAKGLLQKRLEESDEEPG